MESPAFNCTLTNNWLPLVLKPTLFIEFIIGCVGNGLALWMFCYRMKPWKPSTVYLINLALADLLLIFCLPFRGHYYVKDIDWIFGDPGCRLMLFMVALNRAGSILFLTVIALDRFFRVVYPHHPINMASVRGTVKVSCFTWGLTLALTSYLVFEQKATERNNKTLCESFVLNAELVGTHLWHNVFFIGEFIIPGIVILFCTVSISGQLKTRGMENNEKIKRAVVAVRAVSVVFVFCFLPSSLSLIAVMIVKSARHCQAYQILAQVFYSSLALTYFNSMLDPLVFYFSSPTFRTALKDVFTRRTPLTLPGPQERKRRIQDSETTPA
ncbi:hydroxycarboxylic acid receptor 2-like [Lepisosteus oculatus]|uniref:hydroxycarboxylic acid receptor 2-like n=1 Tax=Lepisosteus oculatus TaxID=7918 RepID=UPI0035F50E09